MKEENEELKEENEELKAQIKELHDHLTTVFRKLAGAHHVTHTHPVHICLSLCHPAAVISSCVTNTMSMREP